MRDKGLVGGATFCAVVGLAILCILAHGIKPEEMEIASVREPGAYVACEGIVGSLQHSGDHLFVELFDGAAVIVPFFNFTGDISVGDFLSVEGMVSEYKGQLEIIPEHYRVTPVYYGQCSDSLFDTLHGEFHADLSPGFHAVIGSAEGDHLTVEKELPETLFVPFQGTISWCTTHDTECEFTLYGSPLHFFTEHFLGLGEISGFGICIEQQVTVLYYQWKELPLESIAEVKQKPEGYPVRVQGIIESVRNSNRHLFVVLTDSTGCILIPIFKDQQEILGIDAETICRGQEITVTGILHIYQGTPEILPEVVT